VIAGEKLTRVRFFSVSVTYQLDCNPDDDELYCRVCHVERIELKPE